MEKNLPSETPSRRTALRLLIGGVAASAVLLAASYGLMENGKRPAEYGFSETAAWNQDFSTLPDGPLDSATWHYELNPEVPGYNDELQAYTDNPDNVRVENGKLLIEARRENYVYPDDPKRQEYAFTSGRIDTRNSLAFEYGKFEVTMKLPEGAGTWPAVWLLSANQPHTKKLRPAAEQWQEDRFYMHDGEVDLVEAYGDAPDKIESTLHTYNRSTESPLEIADAATSFHTYGVEITPRALTFTLDGSPYKTYEKNSDNPDDWPFGKGNKWYAILNLALGGPAGAPDTSQDRWQMEITRINFYPYLKK